MNPNPLVVCTGLLVIVLVAIVLGISNLKKRGFVAGCTVVAVVALFWCCRILLIDSTASLEKETSYRKVVVENLLNGEGVPMPYVGDVQQIAYSTAQKMKLAPVLKNKLNERWRYTVHFNTNDVNSAQLPQTEEKR